MRFVRVYDPDNDTIVDFISNNFEVSGLGNIQSLPSPLGYRGILQVDQTEYCRKDPLGIFGECCQNPTSWTAIIFLSYGGSDKGRS